MTDMRRTLLWVVFTMSLVLIWDCLLYTSDAADE